MPLLAPNSAYHVLVHTLTGDSEPQLTTIATFWDSATEDLIDLAVAVGNAWNSNIVPNMGPDWTFQDVESVGANAIGTEFSASANFADAGGGTGEYLPCNTALLVRKNTGLRGRRNRGRMYVPGLLSRTDVIETGAIEAITVAALQSDFDAFFTALDTRATDSHPVILHSTPPVGTVDVLSLSVQPIAATQRRRMRP